jgi:hypothetical protein
MKRKFIFCSYYERDVPHEGEGCCDFYNNEKSRCEYGKYKISSRRSTSKFYKLSRRDDILGDVDSED